jgi:hypothetical protein
MAYQKCFLQAEYETSNRSKLVEPVLSSQTVAATSFIPDSSSDARLSLAYMERAEISGQITTEALYFCPAVETMRGGAGLQVTVPVSQVAE